MKQQWLNPIKQSKTIKDKVLVDGKRMVYKTRPNTRFYGGIYTFDIAGCNFDCAYCWTSQDTKNGCGAIIDKLKQKNANLFYSPQELWDKYSKQTDSNKIRLSGGEPLITPEFTLEFLDVGARYYKKKGVKGQIWLETNGFELVQNSNFCEDMGQFKDYLRIYLSLKQTPEKYSETTGVDHKYCDTGFKALELLMDKGVMTVPAAPLANIFDPETIPWFVERLQKIHKNAPLITEIGDIVFMPPDRISKRLNERGFTSENRFKPSLVRETYVGHLKKLGLEYKTINTDCRTSDQTIDYVMSLVDLRKKICIK